MHKLVEFEPQYQGIIDNLLGRTVVAEDLNTGIAIQRAGRYQFRLVTLEGDVMHSGGSMTGGSVQSRMTSLLSRTREIEETEAALKKIDAAFSHGRAAFIVGLLRGTHRGGDAGLAFMRDLALQVLELSFANLDLVAEIRHVHDGAAPS